MKATKLVIALAGLSMVTLMSSNAFAAEENGVTCPAGTTAEQSNERRNLKCSTTENVQRESNCLTVRNGVSGLTQVVRSGPDMCSDPTQRTDAGAPKPILLPGDPETGWERKDTPGGRDVFVRAVKKYVFPQGALFNPTDNPAFGVSCPSSFSDGDSVASGRGIRCEKRNAKDADCDFGWTLRVDDLNGNTDKCIGINGPGPTKPAGMTNAQYQTQKGKWMLDVNNGADKFREFAFPTSRR